MTFFLNQKYRSYLLILLHGEIFSFSNNLILCIKIRLSAVQHLVGPFLVGAVFYLPSFKVSEESFWESRREPMVLPEVQQERHPGVWYSPPIQSPGEHSSDNLERGISARLVKTDPCWPKKNCAHLLSTPYRYLSENHSPPPLSSLETDTVVSFSRETTKFPRHALFCLFFVPLNLIYPSNCNFSLIFSFLPFSPHFFPFHIFAVKWHRLIVSPGRAVFQMRIRMEPHWIRLRIWIQVDF